MTNKKLLILNGPGLADLSGHDGHSYGDITLAGIRDECSEMCKRLGIGLDFRQTDDEDEMFRIVANDSEEFDALIINPVGYSQAATVDVEKYGSAIKMIAQSRKPVVEVHMTNIFREGVEINRPLQVLDGDMGFICGLGVNSYMLAIKSVVQRLSK